MKQVTASLLAITLASSGVLAIPAPNIIDPIADAISNTLKKWEGSSCDGDCRTGFGWDGRVMGNDPWGMPLNPGMPAGYVAAESSQIVNVAPIPTDKPKPTTTIAPPTSAPTLTTPPPVASSTSSTSVVSSAAPSSTDGVVKIFNLPAASSNAALAAPTDNGTFNVKDTPQPDPQPQAQPQPAPQPQPQPQPDPQPQPQPQPQPEPEPQPEPAPPAPPAPAPAPPSSNSGSGDIQQYLDAHNSIRRQHGAGDLSWSDDLQGKAQEWANNCVFEHSGGKFGRVGENLAAGTGAYTIQQAVKDWTDEVSDYNPSNPKPSHFTQVVWKETTQVGCAVQTCNGIFSNAASYYVCEYLPAGNIIGHFGEQVQK